MERHRLLEEMGDMDCTPSQAGNVRRGIHSMPLREYIEHWMQRKVPCLGSLATREVQHF